MIIRAAVVFGFPMEIPVFDVEPHRQAHVGFGGQLFAAGMFVRRSAEMKNRRVFAFNHFRAQFDFNRPPVAGIGDKLPGRRRAGVERSEVFRIERRKKAVGVDPDADAFDENVPVHRHVGSRFAASTQSYLEFTRPKSTPIRAMPPMPLVNRTRSRGSRVRGFEDDGRAAGNEWQR